MKMKQIFQFLKRKLFTFLIHAKAFLSSLVKPLTFYCKSSDLSTAFIDIFIPIFIVFFCFRSGSIAGQNWIIFFNFSVTILTVLLGFSIASLTILVTTSGANIEKARKYFIKENFSFYMFMLSRFSYLIIVEILFTLIVSIVVSFGKPIEYWLYVNFSGLFLFCHLMLTTVSTMTAFFFLFAKGNYFEK